MGDIDERQEAHYIANRGSDLRSVATDSTERIEVEVRDRYNNPVSGANVEADLNPPTGAGSVNPIQPTTDAEGVAEFEYVAPGSETMASLNLSIGSAARERVNVAIDVPVAVAADTGSETRTSRSSALSSTTEHGRTT